MDLYTYYDRLIQRLTGRYYYEFLPEWTVLALFFALIIGHGLITGVDGASQLAIFYGLGLVWIVQRLYQQEHRWRGQ